MGLLDFLAGRRGAPDPDKEPKLSKREQRHQQAVARSQERASQQGSPGASPWSQTSGGPPPHRVSGYGGPPGGTSMTRTSMRASASQQPHHFHHPQQQMQGGRPPSPRAMTMQRGHQPPQQQHMQQQHMQQHPQQQGFGVRQSMSARGGPGPMQQGTAGFSTGQGGATEQQVRDLQHRNSVLESQLQEVEELKRTAAQAEQWRERWNYQNVKLNLMVDMLVLRVLETEGSDAGAAALLAVPAQEGTATAVQPM